MNRPGESRSGKTGAMRVSVIIAAYNGAATVGEAIESAIAQDIDETEIIVVNDGSTDSTSRVLEQYKPAIRIIDRTNGGLCAARNSGVAASSGEYVALLDADDAWLSGRLRRTVEALNRNPEAVVAFSDYLPMNESGNLLEATCAQSAPSHDDLLKSAWPIVPSAATIRRSALNQAGGFCEEFKGCAGGEDQYLWLLLSEQGPFEYIPEALVIHRRTSPMEIVEKYEAGRRTFVRLVGHRYGAQASARMREGKNFFAGILLAGALAQIDEGNLHAASKMLWRSLRYRPFLLLDQRLTTKLLSLRNARRMARSLMQSKTT